MIGKCGELNVTGIHLNKEKGHCSVLGNEGNGEKELKSRTELNAKLIWVAVVARALLA